MRFDKDGLIPMIIQDATTGVVLSLFYANRESLEKMKKAGFVYRYSRSKKKVMKKGEESGNSMTVVSIESDCDKDALLVRVQPSGPACHTGQHSCFGNDKELKKYRATILQELAAVIKERKLNPKDSYTSKIVRKRDVIIQKLREATI